MASEECLEVLSRLLLLSARFIPKDELLKELESLSRQQRGVAKILSRVPSGHICRLTGELCLVPGQHLRVGQKVEVEAYPASPGLEWSLWATQAVEQKDAEDDGWLRPRTPLPREKKMRPLKKEDDAQWRSVRGECH